MAKRKEQLATDRTARLLGVILFQFPSWFFPGRDSKEHIIACQEKLAQYRIAVEFRNAA